MSTRSTKYNKSTIICDVSTAQCEHGTIKCDILVTWYNRLPTSGYRIPFPPPFHQKRGGGRGTVELLEIKRQESKVHKSKRM